MNLECAQCQARYRIDDAVIPPQGARVRCRHCSTVIEIPAPVIELAPSDLEVIPPHPHAAKDEIREAPPTLLGVPVMEAAIPPRPEPAPPAPPAPTIPTVAPAAPVPRDIPAPPAPSDAIEHFGQPPSAPLPVSEEFERFSPSPMNAGAAASVPARASSPTQVFGEPVLAAPATPEVVPPALADSAAAVPAGAYSASPAMPAGGPSSGGSPLTSAISGGTPIPEGLSHEEKAKHEKARRLARVLASDIAIYNREKKDQGAREGNLVAVLGYEIKKSWEVYKDRVGAEFANSTPYFRDALNDMLAEGKKIF